MRKQFRLVIDKDPTPPPGAEPHELSYVVIQEKTVSAFDETGENIKLNTLAPKALELRWTLEDCVSAKQAAGRLLKALKPTHPNVTVKEWKGS